MLKQLSFLTVLCLALSLNAMKLGTTDTGAAAAKAANFNALTRNEQQSLFDLNRAIENYLAAYDLDATKAFEFLVECSKLTVHLDIPAPFIDDMKAHTLSIREKIQRLIEQNNEALAPYTEDGREAEAPELTKRRARLEEIKKLLAPAQSADKNEPKGEETRRGGPKRPKPSKGFFSGITRNHIFVTIGVLGLGYAVWKNFLTTSEEDEK